MKNLKNKTNEELITLLKNKQAEFNNYQIRTKRIIQKKNELNAAMKDENGKLLSALREINQKLKVFGSKR